MEQIILNIGIQIDDTTRNLDPVTVKIQRPDNESPHTADNYNLEPDFDGESDIHFREPGLEAEGLTTEIQTWKSPDAQTIQCNCITLEIDPDWAGNVIIDIITPVGKFNAQACLHIGLNSFFFPSSKILPVSTEINPPSKKKIWFWIAGLLLLIATILVCVILAAPSGESRESTETITDTVNDTITDSVISDSPQAQLPDDNRDALPPAPYSNYTPSANFDYEADTAVVDNTPADERKPNNYGIEE